jgi:hypothetical protein
LRYLPTECCPQCLPKRGSKLFQIQSANVDPIQKDLAFLDVIETQQEVGNSSFSGPGVSDERYSFARFRDKRDVFEHPVIVFVSEPYVLEFNAAGRAA